MSDTRRKQRSSLVLTLIEKRVFPSKEHTVTANGLSNFLFLLVVSLGTYFPPIKKLQFKQFAGFRNVEYVELQLLHLPVPLAVHFSFPDDIAYDEKIISWTQ